MTESVTSNLTVESAATDYQSLVFVIKQILGKAITIVPVRVVAVSGAGTLTSCPYVTLQPLLNQLTGAGQPVAHGQIFNVPCWRLQGGASAVVVDPVAGDVGLMLVAYRDVSGVVAADMAAPGSLQVGTQTYNPGSSAQYDWSAGFYLGGWLNGTASTYLQLTAGLVKAIATSINLNGATVNSSGAVSSTNGFSGTIDIENSTTTITVVNGIVTGHT